MKQWLCKMFGVWALRELECWVRKDSYLCVERLRQKQRNPNKQETKEGGGEVVRFGCFLNQLYKLEFEFITRLMGKKQIYHCLQMCLLTNIS